MRYRAATSGHHYNVEVDGDGDALLLLHGFSGDSSTWEAVGRQLRDDYRLITFDILGHGLSDKPADATSFRMEAVAADIIDILDLMQIKKTYLLGYSMGGRLALYLALHYGARFRAVILESASPGVDDEQERTTRRERDNALAAQIEARGLEWFVELWERLPLWASQAGMPAEVLAAQRLQRLSNSARGLANSLRGMGSGAQPNLWDDLQELELPILLIAGALDDKFLSINEQMAARIPHSRLSVIPSAGHNTHLEQPQAFAAVVQSFLQQL